MAPRLTLIHTVGTLAPVFGGLADELLPGVERTDVIDEGLLAEAIQAGSVPPATAQRLEGHVRAALDDGADLVLVTCSSMGPVVDALVARHDLPVLRVDQAMADRAIAEGRRIGVIATLRTTLDPTAELIRARARAAGRDPRELEIVPHLVEGAFAALKSGQPAEHDRLVRGGLTALLPQVDVVVLAQASMARVAATLSAEEVGGTRILASPRLGIERVAERLGVASPEG